MIRVFLTNNLEFFKLNHKFFLHDHLLKLDKEDCYFLSFVRIVGENKDGMGNQILAQIRGLKRGQMEAKKVKTGD